MTSISRSSDVEIFGLTQYIKSGRGRNLSMMGPSWCIGSILIVFLVFKNPYKDTKHDFVPSKLKTVMAFSSAQCEKWAWPKIGKMRKSKLV